MKFYIIQRSSALPSEGKDSAYLKIDHWDDYSFVTMFHLSVHDSYGVLYDIGDVKIAFKDQVPGEATYERVAHEFDALPAGFFSLGQGVEYYQNIASLPNSIGKELLLRLGDIVIEPALIEAHKREQSFRTSLLRNVSLSLVKGQYARVLGGGATLTDFKFQFTRPETPELSAIDLDFSVEVDSTPSTKIHALIGRNGVGKTTILNSMIEAIVQREEAAGEFFDTSGIRAEQISSDYFSSLVSVSFSAFDAFSPPKEQHDPTQGTCYFYIGLKDPRNDGGHRTIADLQGDCLKSLVNCFADEKKSKRWHDAIEKLGSDGIFESMDLGYLRVAYERVREETGSDSQHYVSTFRSAYDNQISPYLNRMSSGHAVVLLIVTRLVETVEEKTLVLLDEPESHLHPPLLSAFVRALSDLLHDRNGVAIIATHSPVVLQEVPSSCVWKVYRSGRSVSLGRPAIETFGENVGLLTSEVFGLEVARSGFHDMLARSVSSGGSYDEIIRRYGGKLGFEGRAILKVLVADRDKGVQDDEA
ncbi:MULTISPECIES: AAA family ATPase [unclassified Thioalkalivibrio]|uniref:AAA family ATPase n=1 Tax=unclassified Thioalkalivibrio TaxID=2621013 RepID=UPI00039A786E|nr:MULTISPECIES: AAA family ATPase [unclassified Thioalkalivibrio]